MPSAEILKHTKPVKPVARNSYLTFHITSKDLELIEIKRAARDAQSTLYEYYISSPQILRDEGG